MRQETISFLMLFCALLLVKSTKATLDESLAVVPLAGKARDLAKNLLGLR